MQLAGHAAVAPYLGGFPALMLAVQQLPRRHPLGLLESQLHSPVQPQVPRQWSGQADPERYCHLHDKLVTLNLQNLFQKTAKLRQNTVMPLTS